MRPIACLLILLSACQATGTSADETLAADLVIYGNTSAGVAAAVQADRLGLSVVLIGPSEHLGGLSSSGLGWTDSGRKEVIGGLSREFYQRVKAEYDRPETWKWQAPEDYSRYRPNDDAQWTFEPSIAAKVFEDLVRESGVRDLRGEWLDRTNGVEVRGGAIREIRMKSGLRLRAEIFMDASYEGDLMAAAGVSYTVGREANEVYGETLNGVQPGRRYHQFARDISPYVVPGDPSSGLLPRVSAEPIAALGSGDHKVQAYNYRVCLTRVPENRVPFPRPEGYDPAQYELLLRTLQAGSDHYRGKFDMLPNGKTDTNNSGSFSTDNIGMNWDYPEASDERRAEILEEHRRYQQGFYWFLANDPRVPADDQAWMREWGLAKDEFACTGHWPHQIYVREARRMIGEFVITENHVTRREPTPRSIGMGSYNMDSHHVQRYVDADGFVRNEGDVQVSSGGPYPIDYGAIVPQREECTNLFVLCALSASHIAYGSIRMEPVFMVLGHSAADAAALAIQAGSAVQEVDYDELAAQLQAEGQVLEFEASSQRAAAVLDLSDSPGVVVDDRDAERVGNWIASTSTPGYVGVGYHHDGQSAEPASATFRATLPIAGQYEVRLYFPPHANRASQARVRLKTQEGEVELRVSQRSTDPQRPYRALGSFQLPREVALTLSNEQADGYLIADAVEWVPAPSPSDLDASPPSPLVHAWGPMREVLRMGRSQARVTPTSIAREDAIGIGALAGLGGEIMMIDGETWVSAVDLSPGASAEAGSVPELRLATQDDHATLFVQASVPSWEELPLEPCANLAELEKQIADQLASRGWDRSTPTPVRIRGTATQLRLHVIRGACPIAQPDGPAPWRWQLGEASAGEAVELVGIFVEGAAGRLTHHTGSTHLHAKTDRVMGHLEELALGRATLLLPSLPPSWRGFEDEATDPPK